jgi:hypothetical protein
MTHLYTSWLAGSGTLSLGKMVPFLHRLVQLAEFALLVRHIIENRMLIGEMIRLDGAILMAAK